MAVQTEFNSTFTGEILYEARRSEQAPVNVVPLEAKAAAAGSNRGQQLVPALVGAFWIVNTLWPRLKRLMC